MSTYHQEVARVSKDIWAFFEKTFSSITINGPEISPESANATPLMLVSTHRSHVDYFLVGSFFHLMGMKNLRFAAGDNLTNLPWIGPKFKAFGAFTIERDTGFDRNYVKNLCYNVVSMIERGDTVLVFPEGGRSYTGSMLEMRIGVLGASVIAQANTPNRDVNYIPVAVSYEHAPDIPWFGMQLKGKKWRKHSNPLPLRLLGSLLYFGADILSFVPFMIAPKFRKRYGNVYLDYGTPISVRSLIDTAVNKVENARDDFSANKNSMQKLSEIVHEQLLRLFRVLPMHLVAYQLVKHNKCSVSDIADAIPDLIESLREKERNISQFEGMSATGIAEDGIKKLKAIGAVTFGKNVCSIKNSRLVNYYAATLS